MPKPLGKNKVHMQRQIVQNPGNRPFFLDIAEHRHHRRRGDKNCFRTGKTKPMAVFSGLVEFVAMACVFDHGDAQAVLSKKGNKLFDERCFAGAGITDDLNDRRLPIISVHISPMVMNATA